MGEDKEKEVVVKVVKVERGDGRTKYFTAEQRRAALIAQGLIEDRPVNEEHSHNKKQFNLKNNPARIVHHLRAANYINSKRCDKRLCILDFDKCPLKHAEDAPNSERICFLPQVMYEQEKAWFNSLPHVECGENKSGLDEDIVDQIIRLRIKSVEGHALLNKLAVYTKKDDEDELVISGVVAEFIADEGTTLRNIKNELKAIDRRIIELGKLVGFDPASREKLKLHMASTQTALQKLQAQHAERLQLGGTHIDPKSGRVIEGEILDDFDEGISGDHDSGG